MSQLLWLLIDWFILENKMQDAEHEDANKCDLERNDLE